MPFGVRCLKVLPVPVSLLPLAPEPMISFYVSAPTFELATISFSGSVWYLAFSKKEVMGCRVWICIREFCGNTPLWFDLLRGVVSPREVFKSASDTEWLMYVTAPGSSALYRLPKAQFIKGSHKGLLPHYKHKLKESMLTKEAVARRDKIKRFHLDFYNKDYGDVTIRS